MDPAHEWASAVAIRGETIVAVSYITSVARHFASSRREAPDIKPWIGRQTRVIDLHHQFVCPDLTTHTSISASPR